MIGIDDMDSLRRYLGRNGVADRCNTDWYSLNGLEISIDHGCVYVYLARDNWLVACTRAGCGLDRDNPHRVIVLDFDGLMRLVEGGEMAYNNMETERCIDRLEG